MGADLIEHATGEFSRAVYVKGGSGDPSVCTGTVDSVAVAPTFTVASLSGYGDDYFDSWYAYVVWDKDGAAAAPQGESQAITGYTSSTGTFSHAAFTAPLVAGDKVLISLADPNASGGTATIGNQNLILADIGDASASTLSSLYGILGNPSASLATTVLDGIDARANNANLNALLGIPDVAGKPLYTCLVNDRLDHATYGLSALDTKIGAIPTTMVGTNNAALAASWTAALATILGNFTPARIGYLDELAAANLPADVAAIPTTMVGTNNAALASVCTEARLAHLTQDVTVGIKKNVQRTIVFKMVDATDFATPETGVTVTEEISKDGGAFAACSNAFSEIANGWYKITLTATEMNASEIIFKGTGSGCAQCDRLIITES